MKRWREACEADTERHDPAAVSAAGLRNHHVSNTAYPLAHDVTWSPYRVARDDMARVALDAWTEIDTLGLYVHVPFCETRCSFCEYTVVRSQDATDDAVSTYFDALLREIAMSREAIGWSGRSVVGLDIGGGTPSYAPAREIERVLDAIRQHIRFTVDANISIETTPRIAAREPDKLRAWHAMGISRVSMGVQVIQPDLLRMLNRSENGVAEHRVAVDNIRDAGFCKFNVDLMYGFDGQSIASWEATLAHAVALAPEAITLYRMRYKLTRISHQAPRVSLDCVRALGDLAKSMLPAAGYHANPGKTTFSRVAGDVGTSSYLAHRVVNGTPYLGFGLGAQSYSHTTISYNDGAVGKNLLPYLRSVSGARFPIQDLYDLPARQAMAKMCAVSFYFGPIDHRAFARKFGVALEAVFADELAWLVARGWMRRTEHTWSLTPDGARWINGVIPLFYAPATQRYLLERDPDAPTDMHRARAAALRVAGEVDTPAGAGA